MHLPDRLPGKTLEAKVLLLSSVLLSRPAGASVMSAEIDYQIFRVF